MTITSQESASMQREFVGMVESLGAAIFNAVDMGDSSRNLELYIRT